MYEKHVRQWMQGLLALHAIDSPLTGSSMVSNQRTCAVAAFLPIMRIAGNPTMCCYSQEEGPCGRQAPGQTRPLEQRVFPESGL